MSDSGGAHSPQRSTSIASPAQGRIRRTEHLDLTIPDIRCQAGDQVVGEGLVRERERVEITARLAEAPRDVSDLHSGGRRGKIRAALLGSLMGILDIVNDNRCPTTAKL